MRKKNALDILKGTAEPVLIRKIPISLLKKKKKQKGGENVNG